MMFVPGVERFLFKMCEVNLLDDFSDFERKCRKLGITPLDISERLYSLMNEKLCDDPNHPLLEAEEERIAKFFSSFDKDAILAERYRQRGNDHFRKQEHKEAVVFYNKAIATAPWDTHTFALAFGNRGSCYMLDETVAMSGIYDAKIALALNYPEHEQHKLYLRMGSAYMLVFNYGEACAAFQLAKEKISCLPEDSRDIFRRKCEDLYEQACSYKEVAENVRVNSLAMDVKNGRFSLSIYFSYKSVQVLTSSRIWTFCMNFLILVWLNHLPKMNRSEFEHLKFQYDFLQFFV
jgi:tetratricopeptide (TPR) repeat protein